MRTQTLTPRRVDPIAQAVYRQLAQPISLPRALHRLFPRVKTVVDAKRAVHVTVRKTDCRTSTPGNHKACAMARACEREKQVDGALIGMSVSYLVKGTKATRYQTPTSVQREIVSFDRNGDFEPGAYSLVPKSPSSRLGAASSRTSHGGPKRVRRIVHKRALRVRTLMRG